MAGTGDKLMTASEIKEVTDTKLIKDFSSLTALSGTPATGDLVPIKSGNDTYKIDYNALASAILGQISSNGVVNVANGGTGSGTATGALSGLIGALDTSSGFSLSDTIPVSINGTAYTITGRTLSNAIGGGGTEQSALTNYVKNCGTITSLPATIEDENITEDMVLLAYALGTPSAMGSNWSVATDDGEIEITGTISGSTTLTLVFGVGFSVAPTILTDLSSTNPDNILKASPRPGVTGTLPVANGGTGAASASAARTALDVYSKSEVTTAISQSTALSTLMTASSVAGANDNPATYTPGLYSLVGSSYNTSVWPGQNLYGILVVWDTSYYREALILGSNNALYVGHAIKSESTPAFRWIILTP